MSKESFRASLRSFSPGSPEFMKIFIAEEHLHFENPDVQVHIWEDGNDYLQKLGAFDDVHLFRNKDGLGMMVPDDLGWETLPKYVDPETIVGIFYSNRKIGEQLEDMKMERLLDEFKKVPTQRTDIINSITLEFSNEKLNDVFRVPSFVSEHSMIQKLMDVLTGIRRKSKKVLRMLETMPQYTKFLLLSMKGSFTDVHIDFSGSSVFYHVVKGQKVFYVAPFNEENFEIFKKSQLDSNDNRWIGDILWDKFQRIVIGEGETAFIPGGYLHFVFTPEDSIVIGGNFLMEKFLKRQFDITLHEESLLPPTTGEPVNESHMFQGFRNVMFGFTEFCLLPELKNSPNNHLLSLVKIMSEEMDSEIEIPNDWYTKPKKESIMEELRGVLEPDREQGEEELVKKKMKMAEEEDSVPF
ncbi:hypothetical protein CAEBREN_21645 [Caenorhabditis brenneri]|uniref:JmjC domain-containing protein n=1 Tax=Caenorhabditis brenneri TaxID=135651 RepID=G0ME60_CAEBE|nr:hypothetical protein CAEBREN_21645 [Caenorhabditis brenneri]